MLGVDSAFLDSYHLNNNQKKELEKFMDGLPDEDVRLKFKQGYISGLSGRTYNNEMILFAISISYGERKDNYNFFFKFLLDSGVFIL